MNARFQPPAIAGHVFFSNYPAARSGKTYTPESIEIEIADRYNVPRTDICVVPFTPVGFHPESAIRWAAYLKAEHSHVVEDLNAYVQRALRALR